MGGEDGDGGSAEKDGGESLNEVPSFGGFGLDDGEPEDVGGTENIVNREDSGAGEVGEEDDGEADDEVDEVGLDVEPEVVWADGEHAPFRE